jgi:ATP-binding cassette subfamily B protein
VSVTLFTELREFLFYPVAARVARKVALETFEHLLALSLRFHLERQTGGVSRDIERGSRAIHSLLNYFIYNILPTLVEISLVIVLLSTKFDGWFAGITFAALAAYIAFTVSVTEWRTHFRRAMNEQDSKANTRAVDALINYETVKYFNFEEKRYDENLQRLEQASVKSQTSLSVLNLGQSLIIAVAVTLLVWRATLGVVEGSLTLGDLVLVNALMIQLYIPLNFLGVIYREIKQSTVDMEKLFALLSQHREIADAPDARPLAVREGALRFENVSFAYDPARPILQDVSFEVPAGKTVAVVGASGAGKSTIARLLYRFYDVANDGRGRISIDGQDIRAVTQASLRAAIGIVPQDTVLFNDTVEYNIAYGRPGADREAVEGAAKAAHIHTFIASTPAGYDTMVGERGLKLSGGEKQRVAIARTLLKNPPILIFDEATSALDSANERAIQAELKSAAQGKTALVIAHRLSTISDAHEIVVLDHAAVVERGSHAVLLALDGRYARMWALQQAGQEAGLQTDTDS